MCAHSCMFGLAATKRRVNHNHRYLMHLLPHAPDPAHSLVYPFHSHTINLKYYIRSVTLIHLAVRSIVDALPLLPRVHGLSNLPCSCFTLPVHVSFDSSGSPQCQIPISPLIPPYLQYRWCYTSLKTSRAGAFREALRDAGAQLLSHRV